VEQLDDHQERYGERGRAELKQQPGQDILIFGSGQLVSGLLEHGLIDELRLLVHPVVLGRGKRLFAEGSPVGLTAADAKVFGSGIVLLVFQPAGNKS
jgi:dihydrofolate reductase